MGIGASVGRSSNSSLHASYLGGGEDEKEKSMRGVDEDEKKMSRATFEKLTSLVEMLAEHADREDFVNEDVDSHEKSRTKIENAAEIMKYAKARTRRVAREIDDHTSNAAAAASQTVPTDSAGSALLRAPPRCRLNLERRNE